MVSSFLSSGCNTIFEKKNICPNQNFYGAGSGSHSPYELWNPWACPYSAFWFRVSAQNMSALNPSFNPLQEKGRIRTPCTDVPDYFPAYTWQPQPLGPKFCFRRSPLNCPKNQYIYCLRSHFFAFKCSFDQKDFRKVNQKIQPPIPTVGFRLLFMIYFSTKTYNFRKWRLRYRFGFFPPGNYATRNPLLTKFLQPDPFVENWKVKTPGIWLVHPCP